MKLLAFFKNGEKFIHNNIIHTVYEVDTKNNMVEVFTQGHFTVWPIYNGKDLVKVQAVNE